MLNPGFAPTPRRKPKALGPPSMMGDAPSLGANWGLSYGGGDQALDPPMFQPAMTSGGLGRPGAPTLFDGSSSSTPLRQPAKAPAAPTGGYTEQWGQSYAPQTAAAPQTPAAVAGTADPLAQDRTARGVYGDLQAAGHDVKWQGEQLIVDGRPYVLGDKGTAVASVEGGDPGDLPQDDPQAPDPEPTSPDTPPPSAPQGPRPFDRTDFRDRWMATGEDRAAQEALLAEYGLTADGAGRVTLPTGEILDLRYGARAGGTRATWTNAGGMQNGRAVTGGGGVGETGGGYRRGLGGPGGTSGGFSWEDILSRLESGESSQGLERLMQQLMANPSSLDEHAVGSMKARMKDTLAEQAQFEEQDRGGWANSMGIDDSPWYASERAAGDRSRNQAIAQGAQDIDIEAAQTRASDMRAAAGIGQSYQHLRGQQLMGALAADMDRLGLQFNYDQLSQQNDQFLRDLGMRLQQLAQMDRQFGANYGLDLERLRQQADRDAWERSYAEERDL